MKPWCRGPTRSILLVICFFLAFAGFSASSDLVDNNEFRLHVLLVIDVSDFSCPSCLESILDFMCSIPSPIRENWTAAVWRVCQSDEKNEADLKNRIWHKKMRGFISANSIDFPIWMIPETESEAFFSEGSRLLIFPPQSDEVLSFSFPPAFEERKNVQNLFDEWIRNGIR